MPIWLRRFTFEKIKEHYEKPQKEKEAKQLEEAKKTSKKIEIPKEVRDTYKVKAPTKK
jgi:uncharacterized damage-inducible protein DinB